MSNQIRQVKEATDIVQIIGERLQLQRAGRNLKANCPFHSEKSPSFFVSPELQVFRCFGCGERGDVFSFLEKYDGLTFGEALKLLADRAGIKLESHHFSAEDTQRERLLQILDLAKTYYNYLLTTHQIGQKGREYLRERGVTNETIAEFQLGFAPNSWDGLIKYLHGKKKYQLEDMLATGLIIQREGAQRNSTNARDYYDRFRGRIIFPLTDHRGRVVGFSGRVLNPDEKSAKYINSPETLLYHKSELLFGYSQHYRALREAQIAIIVEGEFDVISSAQAHVRNVVGIKGSAFTKEHVERLQRVVNTVVLSLDADKAGVAATKRAVEVARGSELRIKVLPAKELGGKDPDDMAREDPKGWRELVKKSISAYQFLIEAAIAQHDISTGEGKQAVVTELAEVLLSIPHVIEQSHYLEELAKKLHISIDILRKDLASYRVKKQVVTNSAPLPTEPEWTAQEKREAYILGELIKLSPEKRINWMNKINTNWITHAGLRKIFEQIQQSPATFQLKQFASHLPAELQSLFGEVYLQTVDQDEVNMAVFEKNILRIRQIFLEEKKQNLQSKLAELDTITDKTQQQELEEQRILQEFQKVDEEIKRDLSDPSLVKYKN